MVIGDDMKPNSGYKTKWQKGLNRAIILYSCLCTSGDPMMLNGGPDQPAKF